ncbi:hypothetical protein LXL04_035127 [Taraxacum kok-saghyz]
MHSALSVRKPTEVLSNITSLTVSHYLSDYLSQPVNMLPLLLLSSYSSRSENLARHVHTFSRARALLSKENTTMDTITCSLTSDNLAEIRENFKLSAALKLELPSENQRIKTPLEGYVGIYHQFLKAGLRFPVFDFLKTVLSHYKLHIAQLAPNSFRKIICFVMLSRALGVTPSLILFRHFYVTLNTGDWVSFTRRQGVDDIGDCFPSSIKNWKPEFLFVDAKEFNADMSFGEHKNRTVDHPPELSAEQKQIVDQMVVNTVKWSDPDEVTLGMAGLSSYWTGRGKQPICLVGGKTVTLLDRLQRKKFKGTIEVTEGPISDFLGPSVLDTLMEEESSMDSAAAAENASDTTSGSAKIARQGLKAERGGGRPPSHPGKVNKGSYILKKRAPDSEKTSPVAEEKNVTTSKRRRLIRGGQHPGKVADPLSSNVPSSTTPIPSGPVTLAPALFDCPVSSDPSLNVVPSDCSTSPIKAIDFSRAVLPSIASLIRSVDLPIPPTEEMGASSEAVISSSILGKPTAVKASKSAFHRTLANAGLGFGKFAKAVVSSPDLLVASEKQTEDAGFHHDVLPMSASDGVEAILNIPDVPASLESGDKVSGMSTPTVVKGKYLDRLFGVILSLVSSNCVLYGSVSSVESDPVHPSFMSLSTALPAFMHPYTPSSIAKPPGLGNLSEEEGLDRARSLFLEGMHWATQVMLTQRTRAASLLAQKAEFDRVSAKVDEVNATHVQMMDERTKLLQDYQRMELRNQELTMEIDGMKEKHREMLEMNQATGGCPTIPGGRLEEAGQQFESLKALFSEKVSGLEILCNQKEVVVIRQEAELQGQKGRLIELDERVKTLTANCSAARQESLFYQQMSEQHAGDLSWLLKQGIPLSVRSVLNSEEFGNLNALCQTASIQIGLTKACEEMGAKYPLLVDEPLLHSYPRSQEELMDRFVTITGYEYQLLKVLAAGSMDVESLKKYLDEGENDESSFVNEEPKGQGEGEDYVESSVDRSGPVVDEVDQTGGGGRVNLGDGAGGDGEKGVGGEVDKGIGGEVEKGIGGAGYDGDDDNKRDAGEKVGDSDQVGSEDQA